MKKSTEQKNIETQQKMYDAKIAEGKLNEMNLIIKRRPNGTLRIQQDYQFCPTLTEQHSAHETDINYLVAKFKPDELAAYIAARGANKRPIIGHDFSEEPSLQEAKNINYQLKQEFESLPSEITESFRNHVEFLKFIDNPANADKLIKLGLMTKKEIQKIQAPTNDNPNDDKLAPQKESLKTDKNN